jgi:hypothetical protein
VGVGRLFGQLTSEVTLIFSPPDVRVHAAAPKLGYTRLGYTWLPRFRVRHLLPRLFRVAFGREGRVERDSPMYFCVGRNFNCRKLKGTSARGQKKSAPPELGSDFRNKEPDHGYRNSISFVSFT